MTALALDRAASAAPVLRDGMPRRRAEALVAAAGALDAAADDLVPIAVRETGLAEGRLRGELRRTTLQLRLFAEVVLDGSYLDARIDEPDPAFVLGVRPDVRRVLSPVGPVLNFAASNFPFAFSVAGGDTASILAAGCPAIVKTHPGHPELSRRTAAVLASALAGAGLPDGTLTLVEGTDEGVAALRDPRVKAATFTGSTRAGLALSTIAAQRKEPIPFYGELGSVNPVFVTEERARQAVSLVDGFLASVSGSAGQLCTKPGFLFVPRGSLSDDIVAGSTREVAEHRLLHPGIAAGYAARREQIVSTPSVGVIVPGAVIDRPDGAYATPTIVRTDVAGLRAAGESVLDEAFGPLSVIVDYDDPRELPVIMTELFTGSLTATLQMVPGDRQPVLDALVAAMSAAAGRVIVNGWPTGVAVTPAMEHGGPFPATTSGGTSVGTAAVERFLRAIAFQDVPDPLLPPALRDSNPWNVPRTVNLAGSSARWGELAGTGSVRRTAAAAGER